MDRILNVESPDFFTLLEDVLLEREEIDIKNFICKDWTVYYNLYNPENFEDPDNAPEWYDVSNVYDYYEKPYTDPSKVTLYAKAKSIDFSRLKDLIENAAHWEQKILDFLVNYTFENGGAYAAGIHYEYAKRTIEYLHQTNYTKVTFLKHNLCLDFIELSEEKDNLVLHFDCSWDEEHGVDIRLEGEDILKME